LSHFFISGPTALLPLHLTPPLNGSARLAFKMRSHKYSIEDVVCVSISHRADLDPEHFRADHSEVLCDKSHACGPEYQVKSFALRSSWSEICNAPLECCLGTAPLGIPEGAWIINMMCLIQPRRSRCGQNIEKHDIGPAQNVKIRSGDSRGLRKAVS